MGSLLVHFLVLLNINRILVFMFCLFCSLHATHAVLLVVVARHLLLLLLCCLCCCFCRWCCCCGYCCCCCWLSVAVKTNAALHSRRKSDTNWISQINELNFKKLNETRRRAADADCAARSLAANESAGVVFSGFCGELGNRQSGGLRAKVSVLFAFFVLNFQRSCLKKIENFKIFRNIRNYN